MLLSEDSAKHSLASTRQQEDYWPRAGETRALLCLDILGRGQKLLHVTRAGRSCKSDLEVCRGCCTADCKLPGVYRDRLGGVVGFVDADQAISKLEHVVPEADDHKLRVFGPLLDVVRHYRDVFEICGSEERLQVHGNLPSFRIALGSIGEGTSWADDLHLLIP